MIFGNPSGGFGYPKTFILLDENGNELTGIVVDSKTIFDATTNDVREGKVFASDNGVETGTKNIPGYRTTKGSRFILPDMSYSIPLSDYNMYDYTQLQCIIAKKNTTLDDSVETDKIVINDNIYMVNSEISLSQITKNIDTKTIELNIINNI